MDDGDWSQTSTTEWNEGVMGMAAQKKGALIYFDLP
jgi:hypothetical protein